jgi:hypothetical protein
MKCVPSQSFPIFLLIYFAILQGQDQNQINQHDERYVSLRAQANQEGDAMARCFQQSHEAYTRGDGAGAKQLSNEGREHQHKMESLNKQASDWIFVGMWVQGAFSTKLTVRNNLMVLC